MGNRGSRSHTNAALKANLELSFGAGHKVPKVYILLRIEVLRRVGAGEYDRKGQEVQGPTPDRLG